MTADELSQAKLKLTWLVDGPWLQTTVKSEFVCFLCVFFRLSSEQEVNNGDSPGSQTYHNSSHRLSWDERHVVAVDIQAKRNPSNLKETVVK